VRVSDSRSTAGGTVASPVWTSTNGIVPPLTPTVPPAGKVRRPVPPFAVGSKLLHEILEFALPLSTAVRTRSGRSAEDAPKPWIPAANAVKMPSPGGASMQVDAVPDVIATPVTCVPLFDTLPRRMKYKWLSSDMQVNPPTAQVGLTLANRTTRPESTFSTTDVRIPVLHAIPLRAGFTFVKCSKRSSIGVLPLPFAHTRLPPRPKSGDGFEYRRITNLSS